MTNAISSTCLATLGYRSHTQAPDWPCRRNLNGDFISGPGLPLNTSILTRLPSFLSSSGFGSNRSTPLGAPSMNSQITALALAGKCVGFGASGPAGAARAASRFRRSASATMPNPAPARCRKRRRSNDRLVESRSRYAPGQST